jgi:hypothetical protein
VLKEAEKIKKRKEEKEQKKKNPLLRLGVQSSVITYRFPVPYRKAPRTHGSRLYLY